MAIVGYARVSSQDQDLTVQIEQLEAAGCTKVFAEKRTGTSRERPELDRCLAYVRDGDTLMVTRIDRLARSLQDFSNIMADLKAREVAFQCLLQPIGTEGPAGVLMMQMLAAFAEFETALRRERQMEGIAKARAAGVYQRTYRGKTPQELARASRLLRQGLSYAQVAEQTGIADQTLRDRFPGYSGGKGAVKGGQKAKKKSRSRQIIRPDGGGYSAKRVDVPAHPPSAAEAVEEVVAPTDASKKPGFLGKFLGPR